MSRGDTASRPRADYTEKVSGQAQFVSDIVVDGMLHGRVLRSPLPHARIRSINTSAALALPGVRAVVTGADLAGLSVEWGVFLKDRPVIATDRVRYVGEPVALVAADDERTAEDALDLIEVDYEALPFVTDATEALQPDAPLLHDHMTPLKDFYFRGEAKPVAGTNVFQKYEYAHGDVDTAFAQADRVFEDTFTFPMVFHYAMEPHCVVAAWDGEQFTLWSCAQAPTAVQKVISRIFELPLSKIRIISPYVGGGFGGKGSVKIDPMAAALAWKARRPVRLCLSINESMLTCRRLNASIHMRTAVRTDGTLLGKAVRIVMNGGAYADTGPAVAIKAANRSIGPYRIPNLKLESLAVYTNTVPGAAFRSIGGPQAVWATESQMDMIAAALGLDPTDLRYRNLLPKGGHVRPDLRPIDVDMGEALGQASQTMSRLTTDNAKASLPPGAAVGASDPGILVLASVIVRLKIDGSISVVSNSVEIGQGVREVLRVCAAEALCQPIDSVSVVTPDTAFAPFEWGTGASRSSVLMGLAIEDAAADILRQIKEMLAAVPQFDAEQAAFCEGGITDGTRRLTFLELLHQAYGIDSGELIGIGRILPNAKGGKYAQAPLFWETAAGLCAVDVDEDTGRVRVRNYVSVADVGRVINRMSAEGQDEGAVVQGLGHTLSEELIYEDGQPVNASMIDYRVPTFEDIPHLETVLIESGDGPGPGGARGMGEGAILPVAPAIANALAAGAGIRLKDLPITPEKVWRALRKRDGAE